MQVKWVAYTCPTCGFTTTQRDDVTGLLCLQITDHPGGDNRVMEKDKDDGQAVDAGAGSR